VARFVTLPRVRVSAVFASILFVALGLLVAQDATVGLDRRVQDVFVPGGRWNHSHQVVSSIPDLVSTPRLILGLVLVAAVLAAWRRSVRPLVVAGFLVMTSVVAVVGIKHVIARPDTGGHMGGGSFPSGHMTIIVVTVGAVLLLALPRTLWWHWVLVSPIWLAMAGCLLYGDIHWLTDILGGILLAWALLDVAATIPGRTGVTARTSTAPAADTARQGSPRAPA
jgi:membrane-associated phospholipid phosphatase